MPRLKLSLKGKVEGRSAAAALLREPGDAVIVQRGVPRLLIIACPCGCGERFPANLDPRSGPAWRLYRSRDGRLSLFPSIWRLDGCNSHYIVWHDEIYLFGSDAEDSSEDVAREDLRERVLERISYDRLVAFVTVANELDEVPWDVLQVCQRLRRLGELQEGSGPDRQRFRRVRT